MTAEELTQGRCIQEEVSRVGDSTWWDKVGLSVGVPDKLECESDRKARSGCTIIKLFSPSSRL